MRPQPLALAAQVVGNGPVGTVQNGAGGAVVLLQAHHRRVAVAALKAQDILDGGAPEFVDGLVVVAHHHEHAARRQQLSEHKLRMVGVLILVDHDKGKAPCIVLAQLGLLPQQPHGQENEVVKIHGAGRRQARLVGGIELYGVAHAEIVFVLGGKLLRPLQRVLGPADDAQHLGRGEFLVVKPRLADALLHEAAGIVGIVNGKVFRVAQTVGIFSQNARAQRVKGAGHHLVAARPHLHAQPLLELARRLVGEGDGQHAPRPDRLCPHKAQNLALHPGLRLLGVFLQNVHRQLA